MLGRAEDAWPLEVLRRVGLRARWMDGFGGKGVVSLRGVVPSRAVPRPVCSTIDAPNRERDAGTSV